MQYAEIDLGRKFRAPTMDEQAHRNLLAKPREGIRTDTSNHTRNLHDRILFRLLQPLTILVSQYRGLGRRNAGYRPMATNIGWRHFQHYQPTCVCVTRNRCLPSKRYMRQDLQDWTRHCGLSITFPPSVFPVNSVKAMRGCILLEATKASWFRLPASLRGPLARRRGHFPAIGIDGNLREPRYPATDFSPASPRTDQKQRLKRIPMN